MTTPRTILVSLALDGVTQVYELLTVDDEHPSAFVGIGCIDPQGTERRFLVPFVLNEVLSAPVAISKLVGFAPDSVKIIGHGEPRSDDHLFGFLISWKRDDQGRSTDEVERFVIAPIWDVERVSVDDFSEERLASFAGNHNPFIRAWVPVWGANDPDYAPWFVGSTDEAALSDAVLNELLQTCVASGGTEPEDFAEHLRRNGYIIFQTAAPGRMFVAHLPVQPEN